MLLTLVLPLKKKKIKETLYFRVFESYDAREPRPIGCTARTMRQTTRSTVHRRYRFSPFSGNFAPIPSDHAGHSKDDVSSGRFGIRNVPVAVDRVHTYHRRFRRKNGT